MFIEENLAKYLALAGRRRWVEASGAINMSPLQGANPTRWTRCEFLGSGNSGRRLSLR